MILVKTLVFLLLLVNRLECEVSTGVVHIPSEEEDLQQADEGKKLVKSIKFADVNTNADDVFMPTSEWQVVKENQAIPKGLHIRLNMQTGQKEAKLLDDDSDGEKMRQLNGDLFKEKSPMASAKFDHEKLKEALKSLKDGKSKFNADDLIQGEEILADSMDEDEREAVKSQFRTYDELKKDFEGLNMTVKTDNEIMKELLERYNRGEATKEEKLLILQDFEFYVHQYDNGLLFCDIGAFKMIMNELNSTKSELELKTHAALALGGAMQGSPKVQIYAIENGLLQLTLNLMSKHDNNNELSLKIVYVLSTLMRHFPYAQIKFQELGGVQILNAFMQKSTSHKLKVKILTLVDDLVREKIEILSRKQLTNDPNVILKIEQYEKTNLQERIADTDWCNYLTKLLAESTEHDTMEKILHSIKTLLNSCKKRIKNVKAFSLTLSSVINTYSDFAARNDNDEYFKQISDLASSIKEELSTFGKEDL